MSKTIRLKYTGACKGEYWDENGPHMILPGQEVDFSSKIAEIRLEEPVWEAVKDTEPEKDSESKSSTKKSKAEEVK